MSPSRLVGPYRLAHERILSYRDDEKAAGNRRARKPSKPCLGLLVRECREIVKELPSDSDWANLARQLWTGMYHEEELVALAIYRQGRARFGPGELIALLSQLDNWLTVDEVGWLVGREVVAGTGGEVLQQTMSLIDNRNEWLRRLSLVSLVTPARRGLASREIQSTLDAVASDASLTVVAAAKWLERVARTGA